MIQHARIAVAGTTVEITAAEGRDYRPGQNVIVLNQGSNPCWLGAADVTDTTGYQLAAGATLSLSLESGESLHAIATALATTNLHVLRTRV